MSYTPKPPSGPTGPRKRGVVKETPHRVDLDEIRRNAARERVNKKHGTKPTR